MRKLVFALLCCITYSTASFCQSELDSDKKFNHYIGVQANPLLRQLLSIGTTPAISNPYLLNYSINSTKKGWGAHVGIGATYDNIKNNDGITDRSTDIAELFARIGVDRVFNLEHRFQAGFGFDGIYQSSENKTRSQIISFDTITTNSHSKIERFGGGFRGFVRYHISPRILIGTESTIYYSLGTNNVQTSITQTQFGFPGSITTTTTTTDNQDVASLRVAVPIAIYLIVWF